MKILLVSDSHGDNETLQKILDTVDCDTVLHCGDVSVDKRDPILKRFRAVKGNHDDIPLPMHKRFRLGNKILLLTHGHYFNVHGGYDKLLRHMEEKNCDICFHGHTHVPNMEIINEKVIINPGSTMYNRGDFNAQGSYAIVEIDEDVKCTFYNSVTQEEMSLEEIKAKGKEMLALFKEFSKRGRF